MGGGIILIKTIATLVVLYFVIFALARRTGSDDRTAAGCGWVVVLVYLAYTLTRFVTSD